MRKSASAFFAHARVSFFIEHFSLRHDLVQERIAFLQPPGEFPRCAHDQIHRKRHRDGEANFDSLVNGIAGRHDYEHVDVAIGVRRTIGVRAKKYNLVRVESFGNLPREAADGTNRNLGPAIPAFGLDRDLDTTLAAHVIIMTSKYRTYHTRRKFTNRVLSCLAAVWAQI